MATIEYIEYSPKRQDLTGQPFGSLTVLFYAYTQNGRACWYCVCDCGRTRVVDGGNLRTGHTIACDHCILRLRADGLSHLPEYNSWEAMNARCYHPTSQQAKEYYQDRSISVSEEWRSSFKAFYTDVGPRPSPQHTLERRDNSLGYFKENVYWATKKQQACNRRSNIYVTFQDRTQTLSQWEQQLGMKHGQLSQRRRLGWSWERALSTPIRSYIISK